MIPREFSNQNIVSEATHYSIAPEMHSGPHTRTGTLDIGRIVWTRNRLLEMEANQARCIPAWVQGIGELEIDPRHLKPC